MSIHQRLLFPIISTLELFSMKKALCSAREGPRIIDIHPAESRSAAPRNRKLKKASQTGVFPPACEERKALGEADIQLCAGSSDFQQQLGKAIPIHHGWLEGNHKTPGRSPCRISQDRMGVIWVDGKKLKTKWDASDSLKQYFFSSEWIGRVLLFHSPMAIYNDPKTLVLYPAESGLVFGIFDLHTPLISTLASQEQPPAEKWPKLHEYSRKIWLHINLFTV